MMFHSLVVGLCFLAIITFAKDIFIDQDYSDLFFHSCIYFFAMLALCLIDFFGGDLIGFID